MKRLFISLIILVAVLAIVSVVSIGSSRNRATTVITATFDTNISNLATSSSLSIDRTATTSNNSGCPSDLMPVSMVRIGSNPEILCVHEPPPNPLNYLIGTGTQIYSLTGYYIEYNQTYYGEDFDPTQNQPRVYACKGFVVTGGSQDFIDAYNKRIPKIDNKTIVNFSSDDLHGFTPDFNNLLSSSNENHQLYLKIKVGMLPERDTEPCEYWGIHFRILNEI